MNSSHGLIMFTVRLLNFPIRSRRHKTLMNRVIFGSLLLTLSLTIYYSFNSYSQSNPITHQLQLENTTDIQKVCEYLFTNPIVKSDDVVIESIHSHFKSSHQHLLDFRKCRNFKLFYGHPVESSMEERQFPLAFSLSIHENIEQVSRLLRLIYRPHNLYCIHVDLKSPQAFYDEVMELATCFGSNVILVNRSESINIHWGYYSLLEAFLLCADKLIKNTDYMWKYLLNVSGKELPLRTNWELVTALKAINESNIIEGLGLTPNPSRWPKMVFSFPFTWSKGSFYVAVKREFVRFYQTDPKAKEILNAMKAERYLRKHPDELYFSTLNYNPQLGAPGACNLPNNSDSRNKFLARYVTWYDKECVSSRLQRGVCIIGINHLSFITSQVELFANKFHHDFEPIAYDCTEYYIMRKVLNEMTSKQLDARFDVKPYSQLYCSSNHI
ncbi:N-acetyllactosaminide beta-1,6-N-acetylglucosaminyl-transferase [Schistosoma japonicum]|uniref:N-acetyllactosaminide beta-1,6-N-acetylglucosaminyl-transferase n=1 Tax=Schistosoma japonicum TaxID=6182 RepID=A0A4Z2D9G0_SCHJA|nr:N-acetyllactosaminide beta-1,6-N-acetylglucosaminyl-transferase [Schistosoma japonicum]